MVKQILPSIQWFHMALRRRPIEDPSAVTLKIKAMLYLYALCSD